MVDFTVAICTYNGAKRLPDVLDRLRSQQGTEHFRWQVVVIDNNSSDDTVQVVRRYQRQWPEQIPLHYLFEPRQGIAYARRRVINQCASPWIGFLDDDNWPDEHWVAAAYGFGASHPRVGAWGGQIHPQYEVQPPAEFSSLACCLAVLEGSDQPYRYAPDQWRFPAGAGMV
ncbi:glycosyl transferase, partial [filamentous cyanobacterium CCP5]